MNKKLSIITFILLALFIRFAGAQTGENLEWSRLESKNKEFSITIPLNFQVFSDKKGFNLTTLDGLKKGEFNNIEIKDIRYITTSISSATFYIISYKTNNVKDGFRVLSDVKADKDQIYTTSINNFMVKVITTTTEKYYRRRIFIGYKDEIYEIFGGARNDKNEVLKYVFASIKLSGEKIFAEQNVLDEKIRAQIVALSPLADTAFTVEKEKKENLPEKPNLPQQPLPGSSPLLILIKPRPGYTPQARQKMTKGMVRLRIIFAANGIIEKISVIEGLPNGLTEQAVKAARLMRFLPEEKDNVPIAVTKTLEYTFTIY